MRVLFLTPRLPYPPNRGDRVRMLNFARVLSGEHDLHLLSFVESEEERSFIPPDGGYFDSADTVMLTGKQRLANMAAALARGRSLWIQRFRSAEMQRKVDRRLGQGDIDLVYCYTTRMGMYVEERARPYRILDFVDAVFLMVQRMASNTGLWPKRLLLGREARLIEDSQVKMGPRFDECWMVSDANRNALANWREAHVLVVPQGVDTEYFAPLDLPLPERRTLLFVGYMGDESIAAMTQFCKRAVPAIVEEFPDVVVKAVGAGASRIRALADGRHLSLLEFVPDLRPVYAGAHLLVAPMPFVAGVQTKILEALAMGIPAVVTRYANEGIRGSATEGVLVVEDISEFAEGVKHVLSDLEEWRYRARTNGRAFVARHFRWEAAAERLRQIAGETAPRQLPAAASMPHR